MVQTSKRLLMKGLICRYTEIKVFYLTGWITTFQWSSHGPVIEILVKNLSLQFSQMGVEIEVSAFVDFLINYKNIDKVMWEPFIESSCFQLNILRKCVFHALDVSPSTVVSLNSSKQLNVNISEPFIEVEGILCYFKISR
ncbi:uncharacterized protein [Aegilops tauschii subsp. strangulata]|uniref:uncharacterized protein isoform X1 n=1 Tax=Aegilops tauschii subsp. strangulata TaxID=200361 RepID=UPI000989CF4D